MSSTIRAIIRRIGAGDGFDNATNYPNDTLDDWIADSQIDVPVSRLGAKADRAVAYYTCHLMLQASSSVSSTGGAVKKEKTRNVEREYHQATSTTATSDKYYEMYMRLLKGLVMPRPFVLNGD